MTERRQSSKEGALAARALEKDDDISEDGLVASVERSGDARTVRVRDGDGVVLLTISRFPPAETPGTGYPDWIPFIPGVGCILTDGPAERLLVYHVFSRSRDWLQRMAARFRELIEQLGLPDPETFRKADGTMDRDALLSYLQEHDRSIPPDVLDEVKSFWADAGEDVGALDCAWDRLREWHVENGWSVEEQQPEGPVATVCGFARGPERRLATAMALGGTQQIMVFFRGPAGGA
jgi:hypothetical protein